MGAPDFSLVTGSAVWEKGKKRGQIRQIWAPPFLFLRLPLGSLRSPIFPPMGESGPGFKYGFINRLSLPRFFFKV